MFVYLFVFCDSFTLSQYPLFHRHHPSPRRESNSPVSSTDLCKLDSGPFFGQHFSIHIYTTLSVLYNIHNKTKTDGGEGNDLIIKVSDTEQGRYRGSQISSPSVYHRPVIYKVLTRSFTHLFRLYCPTGTRKECLYSGVTYSSRRRSSTRRDSYTSRPHHSCRWGVSSS